MHCRDFESRLNATLDERRSPSLDRELAQHAARCGACRERLAGWESLLDGYRQLESERRAAPAGGPSADLTAQVLAEVHAKGVSPRWSIWESVALIAASAAAVLLAVWGLRPNMAPHGGPQGSPVASAPARLLGANLPAMLAKADLRSPEVLKRARVTGEGLAVVVMGMPTLRAGFYTPPDVGIFPSEAPAWMNPVAEGLHPLKSSVDGALQVLRGAMPYGGVNSRS